MAQKSKCKRMTLSGIKQYVRYGVATDITSYSFEEANEFRKNHDYDVIGLSHGTCGMTGALLEDYNTKELFAITARNSTLFQLV